VKQIPKEGNYSSRYHDFDEEPKTYKSHTKCEIVFRQKLGDDDVFVDVLYNSYTHDYSYSVKEPVLEDNEKELLEFIKETIILTFMSNLDFFDPTKKLSGQETEEKVKSGDSLLSYFSKKTSKVRDKKKKDDTPDLEKDLDIFPDNMEEDDPERMFTNRKIRMKAAEDDRKKEFLDKALLNILERHSISLKKTTIKKIRYYIMRDFVGFGKIDPFMRDPSIEDISCDGPGIPIFIHHQDYESLRTNIVFETDQELDSYVISMAQGTEKPITIADPILDSTLGDGSRLHATLSTEVTLGGSTFTIRKFKEKPITPAELVMSNTISSKIAAFLWLAVEHGSSIMMAGGTASGKTTMLNGISLFIPPKMKIVTIEDTHEINLPHENWIAGLTRERFGGDIVGGKVRGTIDMFDLVKAALRQRPKYILVGEVRGIETYVLFQAMATGHTTFSTMHADSPRSLVQRLENPPIKVPRALLQSLDLIVLLHPTVVNKKHVRRVKGIVEIRKLDPITNNLIVNKIFEWDPNTDTFKYFGDSKLYKKIESVTTKTRREVIEDLKRREKIIRVLIKYNIKDYERFAQIISSYYVDPNKSLTLFFKEWGFTLGKEGQGRKKIKKRDPKAQKQLKRKRRRREAKRKQKRRPKKAKSTIVIAPNITKRDEYIGPHPYRESLKAAQMKDLVKKIMTNLEEDETISLEKENELPVKVMNEPIMAPVLKAVPHPETEIMEPKQTISKEVLLKVIEAVSSQTEPLTEVEQRPQEYLDNEIFSGIVDREKIVDKKLDGRVDVDVLLPNLIGEKTHREGTEGKKRTLGEKGKKADETAKKEKRTASFQDRKAPSDELMSENLEDRKALDVEMDHPQMNLRVSSSVSADRTAPLHPSEASFLQDNAESASPSSPPPSGSRSGFLRMEKSGKSDPKITWEPKDHQIAVGPAASATEERTAIPSDKRKKMEKIFGLIQKKKADEIPEGPNKQKKKDIYQKRMDSLLRQIIDE